MMKGRGPAPMGYSGRGRGSYAGRRPYRMMRGGHGPPRGNPMGYGPPHAVIMPSGDRIPFGGRPTGMRSPNGYIDRRPRGGDERDRMRGDIPNGRDREEYNAPRIPVRPLTRVVARARPKAGSESQKGDGQRSNSDAYRMEVNEYVRRSNSASADDSGTASLNGGRPIFCVTIRDLHSDGQAQDSRKQRRVWIPVYVCEELVSRLLHCKQESESGKTSFDVALLEPQTITCSQTKKVIEIERFDEDRVRLRTYMDVPRKGDYKEGDLLEAVELRNELMARLIKFLSDVALRYRTIKSNVQIPSLYSYSGERRYYFDLRDTRWGIRLLLSQVTDMHRNVLGVPLESVKEFRDRLNTVIDLMSLEAPAPAAKPAPRKSASNAKRRSKVKAGSGRRRQPRSKDRDAAEEGEEKPAEQDAADEDSNVEDGEAETTAQELAVEAQPVEA